MKQQWLPRLLPPREGVHVWFLGSLLTIKAAGADTGGVLGQWEELVTPGFETPYHVHQNEDEAFYVLEGEVEFISQGQRFRGSPGAFVYLPRGIPHGFRALGEQPARMLGTVSPAGFERFFIDLGVPAKSMTLPPPNEPDIPRLIETIRKYDVEILGPLATAFGES